MLTSNFIQDTLVDNQQIFERLKLELGQAKEEILVAMAWFTDKDLFDILVNRLAAGVRLSVIISDQPDNDKLNFEELSSLGASVIKIKNVGYGGGYTKSGHLFFSKVATFFAPKCPVRFGLKCPVG